MERRADRRRVPDARPRKLPAPPTSLRSILRLVGPGLVTGAADDDPCAIGTYAKAGAAFGFSILWLAPVTFPMMSAVVYLSGKLAMVTGTGLAANIRRHVPRWLIYPIVVALLVANIIEAGADIGGIAAAASLVIPVPRIALVCAVTAIVLALQIWGSYRLIAKIFRWLAFALFSYAIAAIVARPNVLAVLRGTFVPSLRFDRAFLEVLVAVIGTTLSPYLYFWQASQQVEEEIAMGRRRLLDRKGVTPDELALAAWDINIGMFFSNVVMYSIILSTAATLHATGRLDVISAADAASALEPLAGRGAALLFAVGIIGAGFLAIPVLTSGAAHALAETFDWRHGLSEHPRTAHQFYAVIAASTLLAMAMNFYSVNPISALFWASVIMGILAAPLLAIIVWMTGNRTIMGARRNGLPLNLLGWITTFCVTGATCALVASWMHGVP